MTREQFENDINSFDDLRVLCATYSISNLDDVYDRDEANDYIYDNLSEYAYNHSWQDLRDALSDIDTEYDYYRIIDIEDILGLDDSDFEYYKEDVRQTFIEAGWFDEDDEEPAAFQDDSFKEAPITFTELFQSTEDIQAKHSDFSQPELDSLLGIQEAV